MRTARGFPEGIIEAWGNLYLEFALAVAAKKDGVDWPEDWIVMPRLQDGIDGVKFIEASVRSVDSDSAWVEVA